MMTTEKAKGCIMYEVCASDIVDAISLHRPMVLFEGARTSICQLQRMWRI
jgi:hypothetical protein